MGRLASIRIRPASASDAQSIYGIITSALSPRLLSYTIYQSPLSANYLRRVLSDQASHPRDDLMVAEDDSQILGYCHAIRRSGDYFLNYIAVSPAIQGSGVGHSLLRHFEQTGRELGYDLLAMDVFESNRRAVSWYVAQGYQKKGATSWCQLTTQPACTRPLQLKFDTSAWRTALQEEGSVGFSRLDCSCDGGRLVVGLIGGRACKLLCYDGVTLEDAASSVLSRFQPPREVLLITNIHRIPSSWPALSLDKVLQFQKKM